MVNILAFCFLAISFVSSTYGNKQALQVCGQNLYVDKTIVIDGPFYEGCVLNFETKEGRNLAFTVLDGDIMIEEEDGLHSPLVQIQHQTTNELSRKDLFATFSTTNSSATVRFLKTITSNVQLKISKAVDCPANIGENTYCLPASDLTSCHCFVNPLKSQWDHTMDCLENGMKLVSLENSAKEEYVRSLFSTNEAIWTSLTDSRRELSWVWESSMTLLTETGYANWFPGRPLTQVDNVEDCMMYNGEFLTYWGDKSCSTLAHGVCERYA